MYSRLQRNRVRLYLNASLILSPFSFFCVPNATHRKYTNEEAEKWSQGKTINVAGVGYLHWTPMCPLLTPYSSSLLTQQEGSPKYLWRFPTRVLSIAAVCFCSFLLMETTRMPLCVLFPSYAQLNLFPVVNNSMNSCLFTSMSLCLWLFPWCSCPYLYLSIPQIDPYSSNIFLNAFP